MTVRKITRSTAELLVSEPLKVVPREADLTTNPLTIAPDWSVTVEVSTSWKTDLSRSYKSDQDHQDKIGLLSRPFRTVSCTFTGRSTEETHSIAGALLGHAAKRAPAPLYCDAATIKQSENYASLPILHGDFRYRRFFQGQRVAILDPDPIRSRSDNKAMWAEILYVDASEIRLDRPLPRVPKNSWDFLVPCIDADFVPNASGVFLNDSILQARIVWEELAGPSCLPASFPRSNLGNLAAVVGLTEDGLPVIDLPAEWSQGLQVSSRRRVRSLALGNSTVSKTQGSSYLYFDYPLLSRDRKHAWDALRLFDGLRGRLSEAVIVHPNKPWKFWGSGFFSTSTLLFEPVGDPAAIKELFGLVALFRADGTIFIREIVDAYVASDRLIVELASALPDTSFVSAAPVHYCQLASDTLDQVWVSDEVCQTRLEIEETTKALSIAIGGDSASVTFEENRVKDNITESDPHICIFPASNPAQILHGSYRLCLPQPCEAARPLRSFDSREIVEMTQEGFTSPSRPFLHYVSGGLSLLTKYREDVNAQQAVVLNGVAYLSSLSPSVHTLPSTPEMLWGTDGWTLVLCCTPFNSTGVTAGELIAQTDTSFNNVLVVAVPPSADHAVDVVFRNAGGSAITVPTSAPAYATSLSRQGTPSVPKAYSSGILVIRYDAAADRMWVFVNGINQVTGGSLFPCSGLWQSPGYGEFRVGRGGFLASTPFAPISWSGAEGGEVNGLLSWRRPLSASELNAICFDLSEAYQAPWQTVSY